MQPQHRGVELMGAESRDTFLAERERIARLSIPELIELLTNSELATRFLAEMRLRDLAWT